MSECPVGQPLLGPLQLALVCFLVVCFLAALDLHCYLGFSLVWGSGGLLIAVASLLECGLYLGAWASVVVQHGLSC